MRKGVKMSTKTVWIEEEIASLKEAGLFTSIRTIDSPMDAWVTINGRRMLNFCANNYLGLANHPEVVQAFKDAAPLMRFITKALGLGF